MQPEFTETRPRLALVLGSGGVRGAAALGIADVLQREGLAPDLIVGCSSGALFGAAIAMQMPIREALEAFTTIWSDEVTAQRRWQAWPQLVVPRLAGFDEDFALRSGAPIEAAVKRGFGDRRIEDLSVPMRIAATDAASGAPVVIDRGPLGPALCASMALPFIFPPVVHEGRRLVDGVISDPLPLGAAGAARLIVTLGFEGAMPRRVDRPTRLLARVTTAMTNNLMSARLDAERARGRAIVEIDLALDRRIGLWQTDAMPELFIAGQRAARRRVGEILERLAHPARRDAA